MSEPQSVCPTVNAAMKQKRFSYQELANKIGTSEKEATDLVTGHPPIPGQALRNVALALDLKEEDIPRDGKHGV